MKEIFKAIIEKGMSGRYYLTIVSGVVFGYAVWAKILPPEAIASIITAVFISYFQKGDRSGPGGNGNVKPA